jgi:hypothetical protein
VPERKGRLAGRPSLWPFLQVFWTVIVWSAFAYYSYVFCRGIYDPERGLAYDIPPRLLVEKILRCPEANRLMFFYRDDLIGQGTWATRTISRRAEGASGSVEEADVRSRLTLVLFERALDLEAGTDENLRFQTTLFIDESRNITALQGDIESGGFWVRWDYASLRKAIDTAWGVGARELGNLVFPLDEGAGWTDWAKGLPFADQLGQLAPLITSIPRGGDYSVRGTEGVIEIAGSAVNAYLLLLESPNATNPLAKIWIGRSGEILRVTSALGLRIENAGLVSYATTAEKARQGGIVQ